MIVVTTPTGQIGSQVVGRLLAGTETVRVIARRAGNLGDDVRNRTEVIEGSHADPDVLDRALPGAAALLWVVPPNPQADSAEAHYMALARVGADAIRRHGVGRVVGVTSSGHGWPGDAGLLSAAFAMDAVLARSGASYRALAMPFFMDNLLRALPAIREEGVLSLPYAADRPLPLTATRDIAEAAARFLSDRSWTGQENVPVFGPDRLTPDQMTDVMSDVLGQPVIYRQTSSEDTVAMMTARGAGERSIRDMTTMYDAQNDGIYDKDWERAVPTGTTFRAWFEDTIQAATNP